MSFALDTNLLLYASDSSSPHYEKANSFLRACIEETELFCLCWPTVMSYLRIATHPSIFNHPLTPEEAMTNVETLLNLRHTRFLAEEEGFWDTYRDLTAGVPVRGNLVPDAHMPPSYVSMALGPSTPMTGTL